MHDFSNEAARNGTLSLDATMQYYEALNRILAGDVGPMRDIWSQAPDSILMGPVGGRQIGHPEILRIFARQARGARGGQVTPRELMVRLGAEFCYSVCIEHGEIATASGATIPVNLRATNILQIDEDQCHLVYHHTDAWPQAPRPEDPASERFTMLEDDAPERDILDILEQVRLAMDRMADGDIGPISDLWATEEDVSLACPAGGIQVGWDAVKAELRLFAKLNMRASFQFKDIIARSHHDLAYASYLISAPDAAIASLPQPLESRATTIFHQEGDRWQVVHHHADLVPDMEKLAAPGRR